MAQFDFVLTKLGISLLAKVQTGIKLTYTRCAVGEGYLPAGTNKEDLTGLISLKTYVGINRIKVNDSYASIRTIVTNENIETGFYIREFGIYADDPDHGEILYAVSESGDNADYLPGSNSGNVVQIGYDHDIVCGSAANVAIALDDGLIYLTRKEFLENSWRPDNDGPESGLNADMVDGVHVSALATIAESNAKYASKLNMLGVWPWRYTGLLRKKTLTLATGEDYCDALTFDGTYIYAGLSTVPAKIVKIDPNTMTQVGSTLTLEDENNFGIALTFDGTYIYAGLSTSPTKIVKIDPNTMTKVGSTLTLATGEDYCIALTFDGIYIYTSLNTSPTKIVKIDPNTMTKVGSTLTLATGEDLCIALTFDGTYIYAGLNAVPTKIVKIDPNTMTKVGSTLTLATGEDYCSALTFDGTYIYAGLNTVPTKIVKIDPNTMTKVGSTLTLATGEDHCRALTFDGTYIYAGLNTVPTKIVKIDPNTMTKVGSTLTLEDGNNFGIVLTFDGTYIYAGLSTVPTKIVQRDLYSAF